MAHREFRPSWAAWFWVIVLTVGFAAPWAWWRRRGVRYELTDDRVIKHTGRVSSATEEIRLADVSRLRTEQSLGERLLGSGTVVLDTGVDHLRLSAVPNHNTIADEIRQKTAA